MISFLMSVVAFAAVALYLLLGARFAKQAYTELHHQWFDEKIAERKAWLGKKAKNPEPPEETLRILRKRWANERGAQGEAVGLAIMMFLWWPAFKPLFALSADAEPSSEEQKLLIAQQEAEIERLRKQQEAG